MSLSSTVLQTADELERNIYDTLWQGMKNDEIFHCTCITKALGIMKAQTLKGGGVARHGKDESPKETRIKLVHRIQ